LIDQKTILVILSNLLIGQEIERILILSGYRVILCPNKTRAQKTLTEDTPDLIILGDKVTGRDGLVFGMELINTIPAIPLLLLVEEEKETTYKTALRAGFKDVLYLPLNSDVLNKRIEEHLNRSEKLKALLLNKGNCANINLQRQVDDLENLFASIPDGIIVLDPIGKVVFINASARTIFKIPSTPSSGFGFDEMISQPELLSLIEKPNRAASEIEISLENERIFCVSSTPIPDLGLAILLHEITSLKKLDQMKNDFVNNVSHDLRSPLSAILGYIELLERVGPINDTQRGFIQHVRSSVRSITSLVDDLLNLGRIEAGLDSRREVISINQAIQSSIDAYSLKFIEKKITLELNFQEGPLSILANPVQMRQVLDNLLGNAVKYTRNLGTIKVSTRKEGDQVILTVTDTGIGIPSADLANIFERFYRASNVDSEIAGTGLGLSIVRSIVEAHQGRIWVDSKEGSGTTFTLLFPLVKIEI
jgi:signal transduction histidine kinase